MSENHVYLDVVTPASIRFDKVIEWLLITLLAFAPLAFGTVEAWSEEVVLALSAAISVCFLLKLLFTRNTRIFWSWAYVPAALFILVAVIQLAPLPYSLVDAVSPNTAAMKNDLLSDMPDSAASPAFMTLSFYTNATKHDLRLVLAVAAVFFVVLNVYRRPDQIKRLLAAITVIGGSIALLALAQDLFGNGKLFWMIPTGEDSGPYSGTFINHSHYGQFMNLSIGAALALVTLKISEAFRGRRITPSAVTEYLNSPSSRTVWFLMIMIAVGAATVFVSLTRGGMLSMLIAAGVTTLILGLRKSAKASGWIFVLAAFAAFVCVLYIGFDPVYDRLASLRQFDRAEGGRWQILKDIVVICSRFPALGTGLGTHKVVFPMFDRSAIPALATHAENEYAQLTEETGLTGLIIMTLFGIIVLAAYIRNLGKTRPPICSSAYGLGFGLLAIMIHSLSDFGQHLPANALLSGIFCALLLSLAGVRRKNRLSRPAVETRLISTSLCFAALICISGVWVWALFGANNARLAEAHWDHAHAIGQSLIEEGRQGSEQEYLDMISNAAAAVEYQPDNVKYRHWLNVYRWQSISTLSDPNTGEVLLSEQDVEIVHTIVKELRESQPLCPTYGPLYCVAGQLERSVLGDPNGSIRIRKGFKLAPNDPTVCFVTALLEVEEWDIDAASEKLDRAVLLDGRFFKAAADIYVNYIERPDLAVKLAGTNESRLSHVADLLAQSDENQILARTARYRVMELLEARCREPDAPARAFAALANIYRAEENNEAAIEHYRRALVLDYGQIGWRMALTRLLAETDKVPEAIREAKICVRLGPQFEAAERLLDDLSVLPGAVINENPTP